MSNSNQFKTQKLCEAASTAVDNNTGAKSPDSSTPLENAVDADPAPGVHRASLALPHAGSDPVPTDDERAGMEWWNSLDKRMRRYWLERANSALPTKAWETFKRQGIESAIHALRDIANGKNPSRSDVIEGALALKLICLTNNVDRDIHDIADTLKEIATLHWFRWDEPQN